jgi:hypothetical protein
MKITVYTVATTCGDLPPDVFASSDPAACARDVAERLTLARVDLKGDESPPMLSWLWAERFEGACVFEEHSIVVPYIRQRQKR